MKKEFEFEAPVGGRIMRYFIWISVDIPEGEESLWFSDKTKRWTTNLNGAGGSSCAPCRTFKAFKRHLRRHAKELKGLRVTLVNRYRGYDISIQL